MNYKEIVVNLDIISKFLERHKLTKLIQEDMKIQVAITSIILGSKQKTSNNEEARTECILNSTNV